ncbi:MAG TPA: hypothetical protein PLO33_03640 [Kouleothrix sp.]|uniref:hypothetical protein n=1 Tax=Kouleothrix sp. TaxID=2779161 RepID=UPI002BEB7586|nr:hypothetical protein [Kouleothrix sp.]HRC74743.1 hypothetical protein [Kouleothrix sp.]
MIYEELTYMRNLLAILACVGAAGWIVLLQRRLRAAQMRGDMYRDIATRLDRQLSEQHAQGH